MKYLLLLLSISSFAKEISKSYACAGGIGKMVCTNTKDSKDKISLFCSIKDNKVSCVKVTK